MLSTGRSPTDHGTNDTSSTRTRTSTGAASRDDFARYNQSRLASGDVIGIRYHVASILGTWGPELADLLRLADRRERRQ